MTQEAGQASRGASRCGFVSATGTLLAGFGLGATLPASRDAAAAASAGGPGWIAVDLQAPCEVRSIVLTFEARLGDPPSDTGSRSSTTGAEIQSSRATAFGVEVSADGTSWTGACQTTSGTGGVTTVTLPEPVTARWVRMTATRRSNTDPRGLNGFEVYGSCDQRRPPALGWTSWSADHGPVPALSVAADGTVPIESGWSLTLDDWAGSGDGATLSGPSVDTTDWLPATVPGAVPASLVEQGHLPDPVDGTNNLLTPGALSRHSWWFRRVFDLPSGLRAGRGRHVWLEFEGVDHQADVWFNGTKAGRLVHPFARTVFDLTGALRPKGDQALAIQITPVPDPGSLGDEANGVSRVDSRKLELDAPANDRASGRDRNPAVRDRAKEIRNHVRLRATGEAVIGDPRVDTTLPNLPDTSTAEVTVIVPVSNVGTVSERVTVRAAFGKIAVTETVTVPAGGSLDVTFTPRRFPGLRLSGPRHRWPDDGGAELYDLAITATVDGAESDRRALRFGIPRIDHGYQRGATEQDLGFAAVRARHVRVYGYARGTKYGFSLYTLSVHGSRQPDTDLALGRTATASSVDQPSNGPGNAVDGDPTTRWSSGHEDDQWIQVDLGDTYSVDHVTLAWETVIAETFALQTSTDGSTWTTVESLTVGRPHLLRLDLTDGDGDQRSDNPYWSYDSPHDMRALSTLPTVDLSTQLTDRGESDGRTTLTVRLGNPGTSVAAMVVLSLRGASSKRRVLPALYSDNYLWLLPGESRDVTIDCATSDLGRERPAVQVSAYNADARLATS